MEKELVSFVERVLLKKMHEYDMDMIRHKISENVVTLYSGECNYHLIQKLHSEVIPYELTLMWQVSIEEDYLTIRTFIDPIVYAAQACQDAIILANSINASTRGHGHFSVYLETGDFVYDMWFSEEMVTKIPEYFEREIEIEIAFWEALMVPLIMLANGRWKIDKACDYVERLLNDGYIDNSLYGL